MFLGTSLVAVAFMSWGKWVAHCPRPGCPNAEMFGRCDDGSIGGLRGDHFECRIADYVDGIKRVYGGCGLKCEVEWPANIADLERVLLARPVPATRNWTPGETLEGLVKENLAHCIVPSDALNGGPSRGILEIKNNELTAGTLEYFDPMPELEA